MSSVIVKINRKSVKKRKDSENKWAYYPMFMDIEWEIDGPLPKDLEAMPEIKTREWQYESLSRADINKGKKPKVIRTSGICDTTMVLEALQDAGAKVKITSGDDPNRHTLPLLKWKYKYIEQRVTCSHCKIKISTEYLEIDNGPYGNQRTECPECSAWDSFPKIEYEDINKVIAELGL